VTSRVAVLGAGSWGTTLAGILASRAPTMLWARRPDVADHIAATHRNPVYVRDLHLPPDLAATGDLAQAVSGAVHLPGPSVAFEVIAQAVLEVLSCLPGPVAPMERVASPPEDASP